MATRCVATVLEELLSPSSVSALVSALAASEPSARAATCLAIANIACQGTYASRWTGRVLVMTPCDRQEEKRGGDSPLVDSHVCAVCIITDAEDGFRLLEAGAAPLLCRALNSVDRNEQHNAATAVANMAVKCTLKCCICCASGTERASASERRLLSVIDAFSRWCIAADEHAELFCTMGAVMPLLHMIQTGDVQVVTQATRALAALAICGTQLHSRSLTVPSTSRVCVKERRKGLACSLYVAGVVCVVRQGNAKRQCPQPRVGACCWGC